MEHKKRIMTLLIFTLLFALLLTACGGTNNEAEATEDANAAITQVVQTAMVALTQTAAANPTATPTATIQPTSTPLPTMQPSPTGGTSTPASSLTPIASPRSSFNSKSIRRRPQIMCLNLILSVRKSWIYWKNNWTKFF